MQIVPSFEPPAIQFEVLRRMVFGTRERPVGRLGWSDVFGRDLLSVAVDVDM
jgi:hypothetical protein